MVSTHCTALSLDLAVSQAGSSVGYVDTVFKPVLRHLFDVLSQQCSPKGRTSWHARNCWRGETQREGAKRCTMAFSWCCIQTTEKMTPTRAPELRSAGWRGRGDSCSGIAEENDIHVQVYSHTYVFCDVMPLTSRTSLALQASSVDLTAEIKPQLQTIITKLKQLLLKDASNLQQLNADLQALREVHRIDLQQSSTDEDYFRKAISKPFVNNLITNSSNRLEDSDIIGAFSVFDPKRFRAWRWRSDISCGNVILRSQTHTWQVREKTLLISGISFKELMIDRYAKETTRKVLQELVSNVSLKVLYPDLRKKSGVFAPSHNSGLRAIFQCLSERKNCSTQ